MQRRKQKVGKEIGRLEGRWNMEKKILKRNNCGGTAPPTNSMS